MLFHLTYCEHFALFQKLLVLLVIFQSVSVPFIKVLGIKLGHNPGGRYCSRWWSSRKVLGYKMFVLILFLPSTHKPSLWTTAAKAPGFRVPQSTANLFAWERPDKDRLLLMQMANFLLLVDSSFKNSFI